MEKIEKRVNFFVLKCGACGFEVQGISEKQATARMNQHKKMGKCGDV